MEPKVQPPSTVSGVYQRHQPERTLLYQIVEEHYPRFLDHLADQGRTLPLFVQREFEDYLKCGRLENGFLRIRCEACHAERLVPFSCKHRGFCPSCGARRMAQSAALLVDEVLPHLPMRQWVLSVPYPLRFLFARQPKVMGHVLGIVYRAIETCLIHKANRRRASAKTGAVTLIQRFGSALNLNIHFHILFLDGIYLVKNGTTVFRQIQPPTVLELTRLLHSISQRVGRYLERAGLLVRDMEHSYLELESMDDSAMDDLVGHSVSYRIAMGPHAGRKAFTLQTMPAQDDQSRGQGKLAQDAGFSLHAGTSVKAHQRHKLEKLCRYIARPAVATQRIALTKQGNVRYALKTPYRDGTTHVILSPLDFIARLAALVPSPRVNLTRFHGVFAPNSAHRRDVTPAKRGKNKSAQTKADGQEPSPAQRHTAMSWAQRLKRVFNIDIETCLQCGGAMRVIASIEDPAVIQRILDHLAHKSPSGADCSQPVRAPPDPSIPALQ